jgi:outer membrane lipoprotein SlyB
MQMNKWISVIALSLAATAAQAGSTTDAILGGAVGGAAGAAVGNAVGGRNGAIIGSAVGGATGVAITTKNQRQDGSPARDEGRRYHHHRHHDHGRHRGWDKHD